MSKLKTLSEVRALARSSRRVRCVVMQVASVLGASGVSFDSSMRWLEVTARQSSEPSIVKMVNENMRAARGG